MEEEISKIWLEALDSLEGEVNTIAFQTYIETLKPSLLDENTICLEAPSDYHIDTCRKRYLDLIHNTLAYITKKNYTIKFKAADEEMDSTIINNDKVNKIHPNTSIECLNSKYTFDNFIIGASNRFAQAAAEAVADSPGQQYNPLFIYGGVGLGKTHLMQAIGHAMYEKNPNTKIMYATGEHFANDLVSAIMNKSNEAFRNKYRGADILLIDDIQFIAGKDKCQEEFFHTFNALFESGKQIVITSEKPPKDIMLEERIKSRFEMGLAVDIQSPDYETRLAILRKKTQAGQYIINDDILVTVASRVRSNIRELEGVLKKLVAYKDFSNHELTKEIVDNAIESTLLKSTNVLTSKLVMQVVAKFFNVKVEDLTSSKRSNNITFPRQIAMYLCREYANMSFAIIGKEFGGRDHSTVLHSYNKIKEEINNNPETFDLVKDLKAALSVD